MSTTIVFDVTRKISGSKQLKELSYSPECQVLRATFSSGDVYDYFAVPADVARVGLISAINESFSLGSWFHKAIKLGGYEYKRVVKRIEPDYSASDLTLEEYQAEISRRIQS